MITVNQSGLKWIGLSILVIIADQLTKQFAVQMLFLHQPVEIIAGLNMTLMFNTGAAFSFLSQAGGWQRWFFIVITSVVCVLIIYWMYRLPKTNRWFACALALILGGALGNVWDRIMLGYVIDFIDVYYQGWHWPAFNIADSAISIGAIMIIIETIFFPDQTETRV